MGGRFQRGFVGRCLGVPLALACILLVVTAGTVQVAHSHADRADLHPNCPLCAVSHVTLHQVEAPTPVPAIRVVAVPEATPLAFVSSVLSTFALFTRPPPVA